MSNNELFISGIGVSEDVVATVVSHAVEKVEGIASVGSADLASNIAQSLISVFSSTASAAAHAVDVDVEDEKLHVSVHVAAFYGYPFLKLAEQVRAAAAQAITEQMGLGVSAVDVVIDNLVFPKE